MLLPINDNIPTLTCLIKFINLFFILREEKVHLQSYNNEAFSISLGFPQTFFTKVHLLVQLNSNQNYCKAAYLQRNKKRTSSLTS